MNISSAIRNILFNSRRKTSMTLNIFNITESIERSENTNELDEHDQGFASRLIKIIQTKIKSQGSWNDFRLSGSLDTWDSIDFRLVRWFTIFTPSITRSIIIIIIITIITSIRHRCTRSTFHRIFIILDFRALPLGHTMPTRKHRTTIPKTRTSRPKITRRKKILKKNEPLDRTFVKVPFYIPRIFANWFCWKINVPVQFRI